MYLLIYIVLRYVLRLHQKKVSKTMPNFLRLKHEMHLCSIYYVGMSRAKTRPDTRVFSVLEDPNPAFAFFGGPKGTRGELEMDPATRLAPLF